MQKAFSLPLLGGFSRVKPKTTVTPARKTVKVTWVQSAISPAKKTHTASSKSFIFLLAFLLASQAAVGVVYLFGINLFAAKGYEVAQMNKKISQLGIEQKRLQLAVSEKTTLTSFESSMPAGFVAVTQTEFAKGKLSHR